MRIIKLSSSIAYHIQDGSNKSGAYHQFKRATKAKAFWEGMFLDGGLIYEITDLGIMTEFLREKNLKEYSITCVNSNPVSKISKDNEKYPISKSNGRKVLLNK